MGTKEKLGEVDLDAPVDTLTVMWHWLRQGWYYRGIDKLPKKLQKEYGDRVKYEMKMIIDKDFVDYFAVLSDAVRHCKDNGIPVGPARGSAAASLVCYLIRMTEVDPLKYPLMLFERFIDPNRNDEPDVDLDFDDELRDEVRQHFIRKYGVDRVGNIGTFTRYRGKNAMDDVARVYEIPKWEVNNAKEFLVERSGGDSRFDAGIEDTVEMFPQVKEIFDKYPKLYKSMELEGNLKSFGVHAAGIVVGADKLWKYCATYSKNNVGANKNSVQVLSVDKYDGEHIGLLKLDALGLSTMGMIRIALEFIGMTLEELYDIPMDDQETLDAFERADVTGIFQFEGRTMKLVTQELKPRTFMDLAAVNALARPGPLHSGSTGDYIAIRHGRQKREDLHPMVAAICESTEGQIIYQEQILQICRTIGNFPWVDAGTVRKIISQKKGEAAFAVLADDFVRGCGENGIGPDVADKIWKKIITAGTYAFNIAHCVSYSMLGFWAMWLKVHHPLAFYAAQLQKTNDEDKRLHIMRDMMDERFGRSYKVLPPHPKESGLTWTPVEGGVRAGFAEIPGCGASKAKAIMDFKNDVGIDDWVDIAAIKGFGPKTVEKIQEFADKPDPFGIEKIREDTAAIRKAIKDGDLGATRMPNTLADDIPYEAKPWGGTIMGLLKNRNLQDIYENHRSRTGDELDPATVRDADLKDSVTLYLEDATGTMTVKVPRQIYPKYKDLVWSATPGHDYIICRVKKYPFLGKTVHVEDLWIVDPD